MGFPLLFQALLSACSFLQWLGTLRPFPLNPQLTRTALGQLSDSPKQVPSVNLIDEDGGYVSIAIMSRGDFSPGGI